MPFAYRPSLKNRSLVGSTTQIVHRAGPTKEYGLKMHGSNLLCTSSRIPTFFQRLASPPPAARLEVLLLWALLCFFGKRELASEINNSTRRACELMSLISSVRASWCKEGGARSRLGAQTIARLRGVMPVLLEEREMVCRWCIRWSRVARWGSGMRASR